MRNVRPVHVLLFCHTLEPGGAERVVLSIAQGLDRRKFAPVACAFKNGPLLATFRQLNIPVFVFDRRARDPRNACDLLRIIRTHRIHILHSHAFTASVWGRLIGTLAHVPVLLTTEHTIASAKTRLQRSVDRLLSPLADKTIAVSDAVRQSHIVEEKIQPAKIVTIYNGISPWHESNVEKHPARASLQEEFRLPPHARILATVGRLALPKGHGVLLEAFRLVQQSHPDTYLLVAGEGPLEGQLRHSAATLGIEKKVIWAGFRPDARRILAAADVCVVPSIREGFSLALLEAMSVGRPIVASDVGGNAEALNGNECGVLVRPGDPTALAQAIASILSDLPRGTALGLKAHTRFHNCFTIQRMIQHLETLYESLLVR